MSLIVWTKAWSSADDGTIFTGQHLADIQADITAVVNGALENDNMDPDAQIDVGQIDFNGLIGNFNIVIDGAGEVLTTGIKADLRWPFAATLSKVTMLADQSGSIVVDIWSDALGSYPATVADTITAGAIPTIVADTDSEDTTLTGWDVDVAAGDCWRFNVNSVATIERVTIVVGFERA